MTSVFATAAISVVIILLAGLLYVIYSRAREQEKLVPIRLKIDHRPTRNQDPRDRDLC